MCVCMCVCVCVSVCNQAVAHVHTCTYRNCKFEYNNIIIIKLIKIMQKKKKTSNNQ